MVLPLLLLVLPGAACVFSLGVGLWVVCSQLLTADIPAAVGHPLKLWVLHCLLELLMTWVSFAFDLCPRPRAKEGVGKAHAGSF